MTLVKICGVTRAADAELVADLGADFIGLNFWPRSKRYIDPSRAGEVVAVARAAGVKLVGLFVDAAADAVAQVAAELALDALQVHSSDAPDALAALATRTGCAIWKAVTVNAAADLDHLDSWSAADAILLDAPAGAARGGVGATFAHSLAAAARTAHPTRKFVLAGGLAPDNVGAAIASVSPWCVDVATGVESSPGVKDPAKLRAFIAAVRSS